MKLPFQVRAPGLAALVAIVLVAFEWQPLAQAPATVWVADDVASVDLGPSNCLRRPRVNGFDFDGSGTPVVGWNQVEGCGGTNRQGWAERLGSGWDTHPFLPTAGIVMGGHEFGLGSDDRPYLYSIGFKDEVYRVYRSDLRAQVQGEPSLADTGEVAGYNQQCVYTRFRLDRNGAMAVPQRVMTLGDCGGRGPIRLNGVNVLNYVGAAGHDFALGPDGTAHIAFIDGDKVYYTRPGLGQVLVATVNRFSDDIGIAAGADGTLHLVVRGLESTADYDRGKLGYYRSIDNGASWSLVETLNVNPTWGLDLELDPSGEPALAYWAYNQLRFASRAGGAWTTTIVARPGWDGVEWLAQPRLRFNAAGVPHIAYFDWSANRIRIVSPVAAGSAPPVDLAASGDAAPNPTVVGTTIDYTLRVGNHSMREATGVRVRVTLPAGAQVVSSDPAPLSNAGGVVTFNAWKSTGSLTDTLGPGTEATITLRLQGLPVGVHELGLEVTSAEADGDPSDNVAAVQARVNDATCALPGSGRQGWWPADSNPRNYGSLNYPGTLVGNVSYGPGAVGQAFVFDGVTGHVEVPNGYDEQYWPGTGPLSVAAWARTTKNDADVQAIASMDDMANAPCCGSPQGSSAWYLYVQDGVFKGSLRNNQYGAPGVSLVGQTPVADGAFHHAALVVDTTALEARLYVDGQLEASAALTPGWTMRNGDYEAELVVIGAAQVTWGTGIRHFFDGAVDDVSIYKRVLSATEIANAVSGITREACGAPPPLVLNSPGDQVSDEGEAVSLPLTWTAGPGKTLAFMATGLPPGLTIGQYTGVISGAALDETAGVFPVTVTMSDGTSDVSVSFDWTVVARPRHTLTLTAGAGAVLTVTPTGAQCIGVAGLDAAAQTCTLLLPEDQYTVEASSVTGSMPAPSWWLWTGASSQSGPDRVGVTLDADRGVGASILVQFGVTLDQSAGTTGALGTVTAPLPPYMSGETGFSCDEAHCVGIAPLGASVTLTAAPSGATPITYSWSGACGGTSAACTLSLDAATYLTGGAVTATVRFEPARVPVSVRAGAGVMISADRSADSCSGVDPSTFEPAPRTCVLSLPVGDNRLTAAPIVPLGGIEMRWTIGGTLVATGADFALPVSQDMPPVTPAAEMFVPFGVDVQSIAPASVTSPLPAADFACVGPACQGRAPFLSTVTFTASPVTGQSVFERWEGACAATTTACAMLVDPRAAPDGLVARAVFRAFVAPSVDNPGPLEMTEGDSISLPLHPVVDASRVDQRVVTVQGLPPGITFNQATLTLEGTLSPLSAGTYTVQVTVSDGLSAASVSIGWTVLAGNRPPVPGDDQITVTSMSQASVVNALANDSDPNGDVLVIDSVTTPQFGTVTIAGAQLSYRPRIGEFTGSDTFTYTVRDPDGATGTATVRVTTPGDRLADVRAAVGTPVASSATGYPEIPMTVQNAGPSSATATRLTLAGVAARIATIVPTRGSDTCRLEGADWICDLQPLASGASASFRARPSAAGVGAAWALTVEAWADEVDGAPANNRAQTSINVQPATADLAATLDGPVESVLVNGDLVFTASVRNLGPSSSVQVPVTLQLAGTAVGAPPSGCATSTSGFSCTVPPLAAGASWTVTVTRRSATPGTLTSTLSIGADAVAVLFMTDPVAANNAMSRDVVVVNDAIVRIAVNETVLVQSAVTSTGGAPVARIEVLETVIVSDTAGFVGGDEIARIEVGETILVAEAVNGVRSVPGETPAGSNVQVTLVGTVMADPVVLTFQSVSSPGTTTLTDAGAPPPAPPGYRMAEPPLAFELSTTAAYDGPVQVCVPYDRGAFLASAGQRLMHFDGGAWTDITTTNSTEQSTVCGDTSSFSPFAVMEEDIEPGPQGRLHGFGGVRESDALHRFNFDFSDGWGRYAAARLRYELDARGPIGRGKAERRRGWRTSSFIATSFDTVTFVDDPAFAPGRPGRAPVDAVIVRGTGEWNGQAGFEFELRAEDHGEPGRGRDWFTLVVRDGNGRVITRVDGVLGAGNIQAQGRRRPQRR